MKHNSAFSAALCDLVNDNFDAEPATIIRCIDLARELDPESVKPFYALMRLNIQAGNFDSAKENLGKIIKTEWGTDQADNSDGVTMSALDFLHTEAGYLEPLDEAEGDEDAMDVDGMITFGNDLIDQIASNKMKADLVPEPAR